MATTTNSQTEYYSQTLKTIKEREEAINQGVAAKRKSLEGELQNLQDESSKTIAKARQDAEAYISQQVEKEKASAEQNVAKLVESARKDSEKIVSKKLDEAQLKQIVNELLLSEFQSK